MTKNFRISLLIIMLMTALTLSACQKAPIEQPSEPYEVFAYIKAFDRENMTISYDEAEMITRDQTDRIAELGLNADEDFPNDFYIYNGSDETVTLPISKDAEISIVSWEGTSGIEMVSADLEAFSNRLKEYYVPYHITVQDKTIVKITEQYLP